MYKVVRKQTRPSITVQFWKPVTATSITQEAREYQFTNYMSNGKLLSAESEMSPDGLELTVTMLWATKEIFEGWRNDPYIISNFIDVGSAYMQENNITQVTVSQEEV